MMSASSKCGICSEVMKNTIVRLPCGHHFHLQCYTNQLKYTHENRLETTQMCEKCHCNYSMDIYKSYQMIEHRSMMYFYETVLGIPRLQCKAKTRQGHPCNNYEYPFNFGHCRSHYCSKNLETMIQNKSSMNILFRIFDILLLNKYTLTNYLFRIKIYMFVMFYIHYLGQNPNMFNNFNIIYKHFTETVSGNTSIISIFIDNDIEYPTEELERITYFIRK